MDVVRSRAARIAERYDWYRTLLAGSPEPPLVTSDLLDTYYYSSDAEPGEDTYWTSGTSTGRRRRISYSADDQERYLATKATVFGAFAKSRPCAIERVLSDVGTGHAANTASEVFRRIGLDARHIRFDRPMREHIALLREWRPQLLYTMPSILEALVHAGADPREFGIRAVILVGECVSPQWVEHVAADALGIRPADVMDTYGSIEIGLIAYYSHDVGRYVVADGIVAEAIAPADADVEAVLPPGEGILAVTSLVRDAFPAVRYVTYDVVRGFEPASGTRPATFEAVVKRLGNEFKHGEKISLHDIEAVVYRHVPDAIVRVTTHNRRLRVSIGTGGPLPARITDDIESSIPEIGVMVANGMLDHVDVVATPFAGLPVDPTRAKQRVIR